MNIRLIAYIKNIQTKSNLIVYLNIFNKLSLTRKIKCVYNIFHELELILVIPLKTTFFFPIIYYIVKLSNNLKAKLFMVCL